MCLRTFTDADKLESTEGGWSHMQIKLEKKELNQRC